MKFSGILLLLISLGEIVAAGVYHGNSTQHGAELELAADALENAQQQQQAGDALPSDTLERLDRAFDEAAERALAAEAMAKTLLYAAVLTALSGLIALAIDRRRRAKR